VTVPNDELGTAPDDTAMIAVALGPDEIWCMYTWICLSRPLLEPEKIHADEPASRRTTESNVAAAMAIRARCVRVAG
jgi:hypothetical protein